MLDIVSCKIVVAEGLQEVDFRKVSLQQLRNVLKAFKIHKKFNLDLKTIGVGKLIQYAAYAFLKNRVVTILSGWTETMEDLDREDVRKVGTY